MVSDSLAKTGIHLTGEDENKDGKRKRSPIIGEMYRNDKDPQVNTTVQRSWVYGKENSLENVNKGFFRVKTQIKQNASDMELVEKYRANNQQRIGADNVNSLPLERGGIKHFPKLHVPGVYNRVATDVTKERIPRANSMGLRNGRVDLNRSNMY